MLNWQSQCLLVILMIGDTKSAGWRRRQPSVQRQQQQHREEEESSPEAMRSDEGAVETMAFMCRSPSNKEPTTMSWRFSD
ncbi:hypothetical protein D4Q52_00520 [Rhodopseudomonas palustris]|uniref:Uncharacterized protein n=1 Tax=Rhodopseudomonas palustris TaxID=1076 RepID=A0A418VQV4_RHOPL|nr:hypothetical protein D4Q52_00520 [Rhodopseudomonas palustris]